MTDSGVLSIEKANGAIKDVLDLFAGEELTIAEAIHVIRVLDATFKAQYPDAYRVMSKRKMKAPRVIPAEPAE